MGWQEGTGTPYTFFCQQRTMASIIFVAVFFFKWHGDKWRHYRRGCIYRWIYMEGHVCRLNESKQKIAVLPHSVPLIFSNILLTLSWDYPTRKRLYILNHHTVLTAVVGTVARIASTVRVGFPYETVFGIPQVWTILRTLFTTEQISSLTVSPGNPDNVTRREPKEQNVVLETGAPTFRDVGNGIL